MYLICLMCLMCLTTVFHVSDDIVSDASNVFDVSNVLCLMPLSHMRSCIKCV